MAHRGQRDKAGEPYILHPLRVMHAVCGFHERMAAVLHDVVEDTSVTLDELRRRGFPQAVVAAIDALSRRAGEPYLAFIDRDFTTPHVGEFDRAYMNALYDYGYAKARQGYPWHKAPPVIDRSRG